MTSGVAYKMADEDLTAIARKLHSLASKIWTRVCENSTSCGETSLSDIAVASLAGGLAFPACLGSLQTVVFGPLRVTSNRRWAPVCGLFSVFLSGSAASGIFASSIVISAATEEFFKINTETSSVTTSRRYPFRVRPVHIPLCGAFNLVVFKLLGGRFRSVLPSHLAHPGAFARFSLPASSQNYASQAAKHKLTNIGRKYGCHSCGRRWMTAFVGDHMPPNKLVKHKQQQRFYPQCARCSSKQGTALSTISKRRFVKTHGTSLRLYHLWLPVPTLLMLIGTYSPNAYHNTTDTSEENTRTKKSSLVDDVIMKAKTREADLGNIQMTRIEPTGCNKSHVY